MKIRNANPNKVIKFEDMQNGVVFKYGYDYFMKIERTPTDDYSGNYFNAVFLLGGTLQFFNDVVEVDIVDCELVVNT